jgi:putative ABC transport system substrate-binding protein
MAGSDPANPLTRAFVHHLRDLGWIEGRNLVIDRRSAEGQPGRSLAIVTDVVARQVDVIVVASPQLLEEAHRATQTIPIVMAGAVGDPVGMGIVASLGRPGGNITGLTFTTPAMASKRLELLKLAAPQVRRVAFLGEVNSTSFGSAKGDAPSLGISIIPASVQHVGQFDEAFLTVVRERADGLLVDTRTHILVSLPRIVAFAGQHRLPAVYGYREAADAGGLVSLGINWMALFRRTAEYVDKILRGTKPAELPVEQPTKFDLVINLKTAKALGLTIPPSLLGRADEIIQ